MQDRAKLGILFSVILIDLIGFGIIIPLIGLYGDHFGASGFSLAILGGAYSMMQFLFSPFWGALSDRIGRRPVLLISLTGLTLSYFLFAFADSYWLLLACRIFGGIFSANISTAQAYVADITTIENRASGMGFLGAAFGLGFILGPPIGGIAAKEIGLYAPGLIAGSLCALNLFAAYARLPESLVPEHRAKRFVITHPFYTPAATTIKASSLLQLFIVMFFCVTFAFSNFEQTFALLIKATLALETADASYTTGLVLMVMGLVSTIIQGGLIRPLNKRFGESKIIICGLILYTIGMGSFALCQNFYHFVYASIITACGSALFNPSISSLVSKNAPVNEQGGVLGYAQGAASFARATGPLCGLMLFGFWHQLPVLVGASIAAASLGLYCVKKSSA